MLDAKTALSRISHVQNNALSELAEIRQTLLTRASIISKEGQEETTLEVYNESFGSDLVAPRRDAPIETMTRRDFIISKRLLVQSIQLEEGSHVSVTWSAASSSRGSTPLIVKQMTSKNSKQLKQVCLHDIAESVSQTPGSCSERITLFAVRYCKFFLEKYDSRLIYT